MARHRAVELLLPEDQRICNDPYAIYFVSERVKRSFERPLLFKLIRLWRNWTFPGVHNGIISRVRYMDDCVAKCLDNGMQQLVILGAGYDTRAYRIDGLSEKAIVFELDHPATQTDKQEKLKQLFSAPPGHVTHIPIHLGKDNIEKKLFEGGYDPSKKTLFIMEGLLMYLSPSLVDSLFDTIKTSSRPGSWVTFDYLPPSIVDGTTSAREGRNMMKAVKKWGEPFLFGLRHEDAEVFLLSRGYCDIDTVHAPDLKGTYFKGNARGTVRISTLFSFAFAAVAA